MLGFGNRRRSVDGAQGGAAATSSGGMSPDDMDPATRQALMEKLMAGPGNEALLKQMGVDTKDTPQKAAGRKEEMTAFQGHSPEALEFLRGLGDKGDGKGMGAPGARAGKGGDPPVPSMPQSWQRSEREKAGGKGGDAAGFPPGALEALGGGKGGGGKGDMAEAIMTMMMAQMAMKGGGKGQPPMPMGQLADGKAAQGPPSDTAQQFATFLQMLSGLRRPDAQQQHMPLRQIDRKPLKHELSMKSFKAVKQSCKTEPFTDPDFEPQYNEHVKHWCRPSTGEITASDFEAVKPSAQWFLFRKEIMVEDVRQGIVGDCWFISPLACLTEFHGGRYIRDLFPGQTQLCREGVYLVRLNLGGRWREIIVDERVPCVGGDGVHATHPAYCHTVRRQIFASMIEKALAKCCGQYEALHGGLAHEALTTLTGWPCFVIHVNKTEVEDMWKQLSTSIKKGFLLTCTSQLDNPAIAASGLEAQHTYSLLNVHQVDSKGKKVKLLRIRNPQGEKTWKGDWSNDSRLWTPKLREKLEFYEDSEEGIFFISVDDFQKYFDHCTICKIRDKYWQQQRLTMQLPELDPSFKGLSLEVPQDTECYVSLHQFERRLRRGPLFKGPADPLACIGFVVVRTDDCCTSEEGDATADKAAGLGSASAVACARMRHQAAVTTECNLVGGASYLVVPLSSHRGAYRPATFVIQTSQPVTLKETALDAFQVRSAWAAYARYRAPRDTTLDVKVVEEQGTTLTMCQGEGASIVCLAENRSSMYMKAELGISSPSMRFQRAQGTTTDWLKPGYGQVVQFALPLMEETLAVWMSRQKLTVTPVAPPAPLQNPPPQDPEKSLFVPFRLEPGTAMQDEELRQQNLQLMIRALKGDPGTPDKQALGGGGTSCSTTATSSPGDQEADDLLGPANPGVPQVPTPLKARPGRAFFPRRTRIVSL